MLDILRAVHQDLSQIGCDGARRQICQPVVQKNPIRAKGRDPVEQLRVLPRGRLEGKHPRWILRDQQSPQSVASRDFNDIFCDLRQLAPNTRGDSFVSKPADQLNDMSLAVKRADKIPQVQLPAVGWRVWNVLTKHRHPTGSTESRDDSSRYVGLQRPSYRTRLFKV